MARVRANGIEIEYESLGAADAPALLLIMGLGGQLIHWPDVFCTGLVDRGYRVVRFDNRDSGLSMGFDSWGKADIGQVVTQVMSGQKPNVPYLLDDMAADALGLMDALSIARVHVLGVSMGGSIAQIVAGRHPARTRSLISMSSTTGRAELASAERDVVRVLLDTPKDASRESAVRYAVRVRQALGSPGYPEDEAAIRALVERAYDRRYSPDGINRQTAAVLASGDRVALLQKLAVPTLVLHGEDDPLLPQEHGRDTAWIVPGSEISTWKGWGHDIPRGLIPALVDRIAAFCAGK